MRNNRVGRFSLSAFVVAAVLGAGVLGAEPAATSPEGIWQIVDRVPAEHIDAEPWIRPAKFSGFLLSEAALVPRLAEAPLEFTSAASVPAEISLPMPDGAFARFRFVESPIMAPELADRYPSIRTYLGQGIDDPAATVRFDWTPAGFHAQIRSPHGTVYIDPYTKGDTSFYASYYTRNATAPDTPFVCMTEDQGDDSPPLPPQWLFTGEELRTYRLACAATGEYTQFHGGSVQSGLGAVVTAVNRVTGIYEAELAVRMTLVANNDSIIYTNGSTDPYTNNNGGAMLSQNQSNLTIVIGSANYDIGHVFSTGGGGVANLGVVCNSSSKARGVTGLSSPIGDSFYVDYVAHEMGHQFGGSHTYNGVLGACTSGQRTASSAYEPGSASTIMGYAGICGSDNLQAHSDPYFHSRSFDQIRSFVVSGGGASCDAVTSTGNNPPTVSAGADYTIPRDTPFAITASGSDPDGDSVSYGWEQRDLGPAASLSTPDQGSIPLFRSWRGSADPTRTLPRLVNLLFNSTPVGERLPITNRTLHFRVTARDNRAGGGGVAADNMQVAVTTSSGPFRVTAPNSAVTWQGTETITWDVAGTTGSPVNAASVDILLSLDGGYTYPIILASATPNDGSENVTLPGAGTTTARIRVQGAGNIFFDISNSNFTIEQCVPPDCLTLPPLAEDSLSMTCTTDVQCANSAACIGGVCYAPMSRYVAIAPNPLNAGLATARRVSVQLGGTSEVLGWLDEPGVDAPVGVSRVAAAPVYLDWSEQGTVLMGDCHASPGHTYLIQAIATGIPIADEGSYSQPLALPTVDVWGDVIGATVDAVALPADGSADFGDILGVVKGFQDDGDARDAWLDLVAPQASEMRPDLLIGFEDILAAVKGFQGDPYAGDDPCTCAGLAPCP